MINWEEKVMEFESKNPHLKKEISESLRTKKYFNNTEEFVAFLNDLKGTS